MFAIGGLARSCARLRTAGNAIHTALVRIRWLRGVARLLQTGLSPFLKLRA